MSKPSHKFKPGDWVMHQGGWTGLIIETAQSEPDFGRYRLLWYRKGSFRYISWQTQEWVEQKDKI